jgi:hypothetical protein
MRIMQPTAGIINGLSLILGTPYRPLDFSQDRLPANCVHLSATNRRGHVFSLAGT